MNYPRVSIIILNWNGWKDTIECLESLYRITYPNYDVIVVDNGSKDDSVQKIKEYAEGEIQVSSKFFEYNPNNKPIRVFELNEDDSKQGKFNRPLYEKVDPDRRLILIKNRDNYGFAGGNNVGIKFALSVLNPEYVLLLNNDTVTEKKFLSELVKGIHKNKPIGIAGPIIFFYNYPQIVQFSGAVLYKSILHKRLINLATISPGISLIETDEVNGAAMLIKTDTLTKLGLLDEAYFAYWEETDFCFRAKKYGISKAIVLSSRIWHKIGSNDPKRKKIKPLSAYLFGRNRIYFIRKNLTGISRWLSFASTVFWTVFYAFVYLIHYRNVDAALMFVKGVFDGATGNLCKSRKLSKNRAHFKKV